MIILRNEENEIVEMFDTAEDFKYYIEETLDDMAKDMAKDGIDELVKKNIKDMSFYNQLKTYCEITDETVEIK